MAGALFILTGAGVSKESGIATFRDAGGLWQNHDLMDVATPEGFARNPSLVQAFYNQRRQDVRAVQPNAAHRALARLQVEYDGPITLVTQNIDDLHERAGSTVIHMHGELMKVRCLACGQVQAWQADIQESSRCEGCKSGKLRPHVVWFGEEPFVMDLLQERLLTADTFVAIGTSGEVYPAAGFVDLARHAGVHTVEINTEPGGNACFDTVIVGPATQSVPSWVDQSLTR